MDWDKTFDRWAIKIVSPNDRGKLAYVLTADQEEILQFAGIEPKAGRAFKLIVLNEKRAVTASFYYSRRGASAKREPEPRMGMEFIRDWLHPGDEVLFGLIGSQLFVLKTSEQGFSEEALVERLLERAAPNSIKRLASLAFGKPKVQEVTQSVFVRNRYVVAAALARAGNKCEMPGCKVALFLKENGVRYVEVHHVVPLAEGGDDSMRNVAALCPLCHRELHHGQHRIKKRMTLKKFIDKHPK